MLIYQKLMKNNSKSSAMAHEKHKLFISACILFTATHQSMMTMSATLNFALLAAAAFCTTLPCLAVAPTFWLLPSMTYSAFFSHHMFENLKESSISSALKQVLNTPVLLQNRL